MAKRIEFLFDVGSPTTYLAYTQLPALAARHGAAIDWVPILLGGVFKATGNASPVTVPAKGVYMGRDMERFAGRYGVPLKRNPHFPINTITLMRGAVGHLRQGRLEPYLGIVFRAMWVEERNMGDPAVLAETLSAGGLDPQETLALAQDEAVKAALKDNTDAAVRRGVFGAPTFFVDGDMFFGQDRLDWIERALAA